MYIKEESVMSHIAKVFTNGRNQTIRLPAAFRFDTKEVYIHRDTETGDVILSRKIAIHLRTAKHKNETLIALG